MVDRAFSPVHSTEIGIMFALRFRLSHTLSVDL